MVALLWWGRCSVYVCPSCEQVESNTRTGSSLCALDQPQPTCNKMSGCLATSAPTLAAGKSSRSAINVLATPAVLVSSDANVLG